MNRRDFLKIGLGAITGLIIPKDSFASYEGYGMLCDTTMCIGCYSCENACSKFYGLHPPKIDGKMRETSINALTVVNKFKTSNKEVFVKRQCMHCNQPACVSACPVKAMKKTETGAVIWDGNRCMGCKYCMIACPFGIPKFEYHSNNPRIIKCIFCFERLKKGSQPVCSEACPREALRFGKRDELIDIAKTRIYSKPDKYVHHIYGEYEAGGTAWLYISDVGFKEIGFKDIGRIPYPEFTKDFLCSVPIVFLLLPSFLLAMNYLTRKNE